MKKNYIIFSNITLMLFLFSSTTYCGNTGSATRQLPVKKSTSEIPITPKISTTALKWGTVGSTLSLIITSSYQFASPSAYFNPLLHVLPCIFSFGCGVLGGAGKQLLENHSTNREQQAIHKIHNQNNIINNNVKQLQKENDAFYQNNHTDHIAYYSNNAKQIAYCNRE